MKVYPDYLKLYHSGELKRRGEKLWAVMKWCELCPRMCGVNRLKGEQGFCRAHAQLEISAAFWQDHPGEYADAVNCAKASGL